MVPGPERFPVTPWSAIIRTGKYSQPVRQEALHKLLAGYWRPIYVYIRRKWGKSNEDAKDLTQTFIATILEKDLFGDADRDRGRFRSLLRTALENFLRNQYAESQAQCRGGGQKILSLDSAMEKEGDIDVPDSANPDDLYRGEWMRVVFTGAVDDLRRTYATENKAAYMKVFERYQLGAEDNVSYESVAKDLGLKIWDVTNYLADARRRLREIIQARVREYSVSDEDFKEEMAEFFGESK